jgi:hypothetical protein
MSKYAHECTLNFTVYSEHKDFSKVDDKTLKETIIEQTNDMFGLVEHNSSYDSDFNEIDI